MAKDSRPTYTLKMTRFEQCFTTIVVTKRTRRKCPRTGINKSRSHRMRFEGDGLKQWGAGSLNPETDHLVPHNGRTWINWACWLHDGLMGLHTCIFYTGDEFAVVPHHEDYEFVARLFELGQMTNDEVLKLTGGIIPNARHK